MKKGQVAKQYVVGLMFTENFEKVLLVCKKSPAWQVDHYNGVGGKVEPDEDPQEAMVREFKEETGIEWLAWDRLVTFNSDDYKLHIYACQTDEPFIHALLYNDAGEPLYLAPVKLVSSLPLVDSIDWLVPLYTDRLIDFSDSVFPLTIRRILKGEGEGRFI